MTKLIGRRAALLQGMGLAAGAASLLFNVPLAGAAQGSVGISSNLEGIHHEYTNAAASWPFALPAGYRMPPQSQLTDPPGEAAKWEVGSGLAEAYLNWSTLMAISVIAASRRGDRSAVSERLNALRSGYQYAVRRAILEDPDGAYLTHVITPAMDRADYTTLGAYFGVERVPATSPVARIAHAAGDL
jgi:hypothetical protein